MTAEVTFREGENMEAAITTVTGGVMNMNEVQVKFKEMIFIRVLLSLPLSQKSKLKKLLNLYFIIYNLAALEQQPMIIFITDYAPTFD